MSPMTIKIVLKGLALCYHKNGQWRAILPFDQFHRVYFSYRKGDVLKHNPTSLAGKRNISLTTTNARPAEMPSQPDFTGFLDLTSNYAHDKGIKLKDDWRDRSVLMTLSDAVFSTKEQTAMEFLVVKPGKTYAIDMGKVGLTSEAKINLEDGGSLIIEADDAPLAKIDYEAGASYTITFDNDCPADDKEPENDFVIYYDIIEDAIDPALKLDILAKVTGLDVKENPLVLDDLSPLAGHGCKTCICANVIVSQPDDLP